MIYVPRRIALPTNGNFKRVPPRKPADRQANYLDRFDFDTVFSDIFIHDGRVWMVGPPFLNLEQELRAATFRWNWTDITEEIQFENLNRMSRASFATDYETGVLEIESTLGSWRIDVETPSTKIFENSNLLITQQQDNRLEWIAYWAFFNAQINGVDSLVIYDNNSELYSAERLDQVLSRIPGIVNHMVVKWDTPYGAPGGPNSVWDSDFGQHISWEHCRRSFASQAQTVCVIDVDELPLTLSGEPLTTMLLDSSAPAILFNRQPIRQFSNRESNVEKTRVHSCFSLGEKRGAWLASKFIYSPTRVPDDAQLLVHEIRGLEQGPSPENEVLAGHFDGIRVRWRREEKQPVPLFGSKDEIVEPVEAVAPFDSAFDKLSAVWEDVYRELEVFFDHQS